MTRQSQHSARHARSRDMVRELASLGMQGASQLQLKAVTCKLRVLSFLAREIVAVRLRKHSHPSPAAAAPSAAAASAAASAASVSLVALAPQLSRAAHALSSRLAREEQVAVDAAAAGGDVDVKALLHNCVKLLKQLKPGEASALRAEQARQVDEISQAMRADYAHRRALFACRIKAAEEAFACSDAAAVSEDLVSSVRLQGVQAQAMLSQDSVPLFTCRTLQVTCNV